MLLSTALVQVTVLTSELAEHLSVFLSILISAFFAMLSILVSKDTSKQTGKLYEQVLKETASTVLLEIVLCMMSLIISLAIIFLPDSIKCWAQIIISIVEYYLVFVMVLNLFCVFISWVREIKQNIKVCTNIHTYPSNLLSIVEIDLSKSSKCVF